MYICRQTWPVAHKMATLNAKTDFKGCKLINFAMVSQKFCNILVMKGNSAAPNAFAKVLKVTNLPGDADLTWYS